MRGIQMLEVPLSGRKMIEFIQSLSEKEIHYIASSDYKNYESEYFVNLKKVIIQQSCILYPGQESMPGEVISLCSHELVLKHAREYVACNLLLIINRGVFSGRIEWQYEMQKDSYQQLSEPLQELIRRSYKWAGF